MDFSFLLTQSFWIKTLELILALSILVVFHEFGHYSFARLFGVWVEKFYMFFNYKFTLVKWKPGKYLKWFSTGKEMAVMEDAEAEENKNSWRATEYGIGWIPLGGYCSIAGMIDESMNTEAMKQPAKPWEFRSKAAWKRLLIMLGGVLFNFLLAIIIYSGIVYSQGEQYIKFVDATAGMNYCEAAHKAGFVDGDIPLTADGRELVTMNPEDVQAMLTAREVTVLRDHKDTVTLTLPGDFIFQANEEAEQGGIHFMEYRLPVVVSQALLNQGAEKAGLREGDRMVSVNGVPTPDYVLFTAELEKNKGKQITLEYERDGQMLTATGVNVDGEGHIGILLTEPVKIFKPTIIQYNLLQSIPRGIEMGWDKMVNYVKQLKLIFTPQGAKSVGSFGAIGSIFPPTWDWVNFWNITAFISIILAVMNVLPIPILDGGHVLFLLYEMVTGRQPSEKFQEISMKIGMALILALMALAIGNDIFRFIIK
ncbi:MAG: RIP metalloprotease RseP [Muribaculaceae bacterium]|nr:RIP metalloprotease RseP [Muribaculaceae bacterium]